MIVPTPSAALPLLQPKEPSYRGHFYIPRPLPWACKHWNDNRTQWEAVVPSRDYHTPFKLDRLASYAAASIQCGTRAVLLREVCRLFLKCEDGDLHRHPPPMLHIRQSCLTDRNSREGFFTTEIQPCFTTSLGSRARAARTKGLLCSTSVR